MDLGLTSEQKLASLTSIQAGMKGEIYSLLFRCGIDPDTYDPEEDNGEMFNGELTRARSMIESLKLIESKITELS
jgi:hypothetical protein